MNGIADQLNSTRWGVDRSSSNVSCWTTGNVSQSARHRSSAGRVGPCTPEHRVCLSARSASVHPSASLSTTRASPFAMIGSGATAWFRQLGFLIGLRGRAWL